MITATLGAAGDAQSVSVTLPPAIDNGGSTASVVFKARLTLVGGDAQPLTLASSSKRVFAFAEGTSAVQAKGLCGRKWRVSGQWCSAAGCSEWVDAAKPVEMKPCCVEPGAACSASTPCCTSAGVVQCVHRTDDPHSATVCAEPPTAPLGGPSIAVTAEAGKKGDTQYVTVKLLPASDSGGTTVRTGYMVRLTKTSGRNKEVIELPRDNKRSFTFTEGSQPVAVKGLCGRTWRAAAQWCNTVGCSGWLEDDKTLALPACCADFSAACSDQSPCCTGTTATKDNKCVLWAPEPKTAKACARPPTPPAGDAMTATATVKLNVWSIDVLLLSASDSGGTTAGLNYSVQLQQVGSSATLNMPGSSKPAFTFTEGVSGLAVHGLCGKTWLAQGQWCNAAGCSAWCVPSTPGAATVCARPPTPPAGDAITAAASVHINVWSIAVSLRGTGDSGGTTSGVNFNAQLQQVGSTTTLTPLSGSQPSFTFTEGASGLAAHSLCGKTWLAQGQWCNAAGCSAWVPDTQTLTLPACCGELGEACASLPCCTGAGATPGLKCVNKLFSGGQAGQLCAAPPAKPTIWTYGIYKNEPEYEDSALIYGVSVICLSAEQRGAGGANVDLVYSLNVYGAALPTHVLASVSKPATECDDKTGAIHLTVDVTQWRGLRLKGVVSAATPAGQSPLTDVPEQFYCQNWPGRACETWDNVGTSCCAGVPCLPSSPAAGAPLVCAHPPTPPSGDPITASSSTEGPYHSITVTLQGASNNGGTTVGLAYEVEVVQDDPQGKTFALSSDSQTFTFKEGINPVPLNGLCGKTWNIRAQWCNAAGCSGWVNDEALLTMPACVPPDVVCWGKHVGAYETYDYALNVPPTLWGVASLSLSSSSSTICALMRGGTASCFGLNMFGEASSPPGLSGITQLSVGEVFACALTNSKHVQCWGRFSQFPYDQSDVQQVAAGMDFACFLKADRTVKCTGQNDQGQCDVPSDLSDAVSVTAADYHACALKSDGKVACWAISQA
ncbi:Immunoglobulin I-set domain [Chlorella sorokiniana]|uniref:Immunoglobulin I-set domain n=1 Tax=Chlorella sorokiniana TaxID=3076 RepID=A0A2P6TWK7_CHLSO|nr:Immunoglobulin I-set domain [Chlorella sorokiniana]|eukprot:PRW58443.1 Immunoglobulin I-set domain [Chlorella sorokiniana]